jgi:hypothetical protein
MSDGANGGPTWEAVADVLRRCVESWCHCPHCGFAFVPDEPAQVDALEMLREMAEASADPSAFSEETGLLVPSATWSASSVMMQAQAWICPIVWA